MDPIKKTFSDNEGNHLLVALYFCDDEYKQESLHIPEEFSKVEIIDIDITKAYIDKPIHYNVFFRMSRWLMKQFILNEDAIFTFICSTDELNSNHKDLLPQNYRWQLFDSLFKHQQKESVCNETINTTDIIIGPIGYQTFGRAFYRTKHTPIVHIVSSYLEEKQRFYQ